LKYCRKTVFVPSPYPLSAREGCGVREDAGKSGADWPSGPSCSEDLSSRAKFAPHFAQNFPCSFSLPQFGQITSFTPSYGLFLRFNFRSSVPGNRAVPRGRPSMHASPIQFRPDSNPDVPAGLPPFRSPSARECEIARVEHRKRIFPSPRPPSRLRKPQKFFRFPLSGGAPFRRDQASRLPFGSEVRKALLRSRRDQAPRPMRFPRFLRVRKSPILTKFFMPFKHSISIEN